MDTFEAAKQVTWYRLLKDPGYREAIEEKVQWESGWGSHFFERFHTSRCVLAKAAYGHGSEVKRVRKLAVGAQSAEATPIWISNSAEGIYRWTKEKEGGSFTVASLSKIFKIFYDSFFIGRFKTPLHEIQRISLDDAKHFAHLTSSFVRTMPIAAFTPPVTWASSKLVVHMHLFIEIYSIWASLILTNLTCPAEGSLLSSVVGELLSKHYRVVKHVPQPPNTAGKNISGGGGGGGISLRSSRAVMSRALMVTDVPSKPEELRKLLKHKIHWETDEASLAWAIEAVMQQKDPCPRTPRKLIKRDTAKPLRVTIRKKPVSVPFVPVVTAICIVASCLVKR